MNERRHIDARYAIAWSFCFSVGVLSTHGWRGLGAFALMLAGACIASRAPARRLFASSVPVLILALFVVGAHASTDPLEGARYAAKAYLLALGAIALVLACPPDSIAAAMERFAAPLRRFRLPVDDFCMMTSIALGAIPDLHIQLARLVAAQASRGAAFDAGPPHARVLAWGRAFVALVVVASAEGLSRTGLVAGDAAQGLVFPGLFSVGVILLSTRFSHLHLQEEAVLVGDPNVVAVDRLIIAGRDFGPVYCYAMGAVLLLNVLFLAATHRRLALVVFDPDYARTLGVPVRGLRGAAMALVALTLTASFYTAGAVLVIAFVVVPAATAALVADSFPRLVQGSAAIAALVAVPAFFATYWTGRPTSSWTALAYGLVFLAVHAAVRLSRRRRRSRSLTESAPAPPGTSE